MRASQLRQSPLVPQEGIEPPRFLRAQDFKSCVYTSFTTAAKRVDIIARSKQNYTKLILYNKTMTKQNSNYASSGVDYSKMDPVKVFAQTQAAATAQNLTKLNMSEVSESRGESAYVWDEGDCYKAFVIEGLGTKNLVADATRKITGKTYYDQISQDTVAMIVNDLVTVGAKPMVVNAYFGIGSSDWLSDETRFKDLINGWKHACDLSGAVYGGGETPTLKGVINPETIDLAGSAIGIIKPKEKLVVQSKLQSGDSII